MSWGQADTESPSLLLLRQQSRSIADEVIGRVNLNAGARVAVNVEGSSTPILIENAFIEGLQQHQCKPQLDHQGEKRTASFDVLILNQSVSFRPLGSGGFARTLQTVLEARYRAADSQEVRLLGSFQRSLTDTVAQREELKFLSVGADGEEETSAFQRLITPIIFVTAAFVVVYLFFTVRN